MGTYVRTQNIDHTVGERGSVSITVQSADVRARAIAGADAHLRATFEISASSDAEADQLFDEIQLGIQRSDGELVVHEQDDHGQVGKLITRFLRGQGNYELSVVAEVPAAAQLRLTAISSEMEVRGFTGEQRYRTVSGDLMLSDLGGSVRLETVSGDVTIRADKPLEVQAQGVSGDVTITAPLLRSLRANTVSGDVELEGELAAAGEFRVETVSGDLGIGLIGSATFEIHGISTDVSSELDHRLEGQIDRRRLIIGNGGPRLVFNSMSGDVDVRRPRRITVVERHQEPALAASAQPAPDEATQLEVLRALERGEIDVDEATRRLAGGS
jgi:hypothetical protein